MALEKEFQTLEDYLNNMLSTEDRKAFEEKISQNSELKSELEFQQSVREGIKQARITQLKGMLNNIPVSTIPPSNSTTLLKIGTWVGITGLVATVTYFVLTNEPDNSTPSQTEIISTQEETKTTTEEPIENNIEEEIKSQEDTKSIRRAVPRKKIAEVEVSNAQKQPSTLDVYDPSTELSESVEKYELEQLAVISKAFVTSSIEVETNNTDKKYNFHYMFKNDKLLLFGMFEKNLYEILEFISNDKRTVVLYYKSTYYLLNITSSEPTQLSPIKNKALLRKLKEYRGN